MDKSVKIDLKTEPLADSSSLFLEGRVDSLDSFKSSSSSSPRVANNPGSPSDSQDSKQGDSSSAPTSFHSSLVSSSADTNKMETCDSVAAAAGSSSSQNDCQFVDCSSSLPENQDHKSSQAQAGTSQDVRPTSQVSCSLEEEIDTQEQVTSQREDQKAADSTHNGSKEDVLCDSNNHQKDSIANKDEEPSSQGTETSSEKVGSTSSSVDSEKNKPSTSTCNGSNVSSCGQDSVKMKEEEPCSQDDSTSHQMDADSCTPNGVPKMTGEISSTQHDEPDDQEVSDTRSKAIKNEPSECSSSTSSDAKQTQDSKPVKSPSSTSQDSTDTVRSSTESSSTKKEGRTCAECGATKGLKYQVLFQGNTRFLCSDACFHGFRAKKKLIPTTTDKCQLCKAEMKTGGFMAPVGEGLSVCSEKCLKEAVQQHLEKLKCMQCQKVVAPSQNGTVIWEGMVFCSEQCLGQFQKVIGANCTYCKNPVPDSSMGKYCVRFGMEIRQFCLGRCLEKFKKGLKVCSFCQLDISGSKAAFLAPVGDKGQFKDFCSQECLGRYEKMYSVNNQRKLACSICDTQVETNIVVTHKKLEYRLCSDLCLASFRYKNKITSSICDTCYTLYKSEDKSVVTIPYENTAKNFCSKSCMSLFVLSHRKIIPCGWCKVKKYNFDMIQKVGESENMPLFCSLYCLSMFRTTAPALASPEITCDHCKKSNSAQYHLTMSDSSLRNFCSYPCVLSYQGQFSTATTTTTTTSTATTEATTASPVISSVMSLAPATGRASPSSPVVIREVLVKPEPPKNLKNKATLCKPITQSKAVAVKPTASHKACQTDGIATGIIPVPVPIFVPVPLHMFNRTVPTPFPFPIPQPVPIFVPTPFRSLKQINAKVKELLEAHNKEGETPSNGDQPEEAAGKRKREPQDNEEEPEAKVAKVQDRMVDLMEHWDDMFQELKRNLVVEAFQQWLRVKTEQMGESQDRPDDLLELQPEDLACYLQLFVKELRRPGETQEPYPPDLVYYLCLGIQAHLTHHGRPDMIFVDEPYQTFSAALTEVLKQSPHVTEPGKLLVQEEMLWASKELGPHSPQVLLNTLLFFTTRGFGLRSAAEHARITFAAYTKRKHKGQVCLAYNPPNKDKSKKVKQEDSQTTLLLLPENLSVAMRCPVKFYEFYLSKCPDQAKLNSANPFFLKPSQSCTPDSLVWFSCEPLGEAAIEAMLVRLLLVRETHTQPASVD